VVTGHPWRARKAGGPLNSTKLMIQEWLRASEHTAILVMSTFGSKHPTVPHRSTLHRATGTSRTSRCHISSISRA